MAKVLIVAEHDGKQLNVSTARTLSCARQLDAASIDIVVFAKETAAIAEAAAKLEGVSRVLGVEHPANEHLLASVIAPQIVAMSEAYSHLLAPSTTFGKDLMPRVAALLNVPQITDIMGVESPTVFSRPIYAGNAIVTVETDASPVVGTVRSASFPATGNGGSAAIEKQNPELETPSHTRHVKLLSSAGADRPDLQSARIVISGGRGVGSKENFDIIYRLADKLGAGVGASRAAVDAGYVPNDMQVGQTGKIIAPDFYFAFGISGAIQHLAGIKDAGIIVAINTDPDAPIFEIADFYLIADLNETIPQLETAIDGLK